MKQLRSHQLRSPIYGLKLFQKTIWLFGTSGLNLTDPSKAKPSDNYV
jgi:hypothetical protein